MTTLPAEFSDLEPFSDWCLESERDRYAKRLASDMGELQAFYDAAFPRLPEILEYLDAQPIDELPDDATHLLWLCYSHVNGSRRNSRW